MDGGAGLLESITSWFTPTIFFCLFNLTVATIFIQSKSLKPRTNNNQEQLNRVDSEENDSVHFFRFPKLLERVKSINLSRSYFSDPHELEQEPVQEHEEPVQEHEEPVLEPVEEEVEDEVHVVERTKSETIVVKRGSVKKMKKSQSAKIMKVEEVEEVEEETVERWRPATVRERKGGVVGEDEAVDAKADDFINRFKQQLKLQRLDSLLRFRGASN